MLDRLLWWIGIKMPDRSWVKNHTPYNSIGLGPNRDRIEGWHKQYFFYFTNAQGERKWAWAMFRAGDGNVGDKMFAEFIKNKDIKDVEIDDTDWVYVTTD